ncbi:MAG: AraC family transcriptional regulator [Cytophagales bacterium]|nr:AraC family transcriptional regulator [Cytophagales bacterium]
MAFPYWRLYWNKNAGGVISYLEEEFEMKKEYVYIIPPYTSFQSHIAGQQRLQRGINVVGKEIGSEDDELLLQRSYVLHFFVHFSLGIPLDNVDPGIFEVGLLPMQIEALEKLASQLKHESSEPSLTFNLLLHAVVTGMLAELPGGIWIPKSFDNRVQQVIHHLDRHPGMHFSNQQLASLVSMNTNSLIRLFKRETGLSLQYFIKKRKIERACVLLEHTGQSIESIAGVLGFANRYHFSKVFKAVTGISPAKMRKGSILKFPNASSTFSNLNN